MMRINKKLVYVLCLSVLSFCFMRVELNPIKVDASNGYPVHNLDTGSNYTSIQEAINADETLDGHVIFIDAGVYHEHVVINKSLSLIGEGENITTIDGDFVGTVVKITADNTRVTGFTIRKGGSGHNQYYGGVQIASSNNLVANNTLIDNEDCGVKLDSTSYNNTVSQNTIANCGCGIFLENSSENTITSNVLTHNNVATNDNFSAGIVLFRSSKNSIIGNTITNMSTYGFLLDLSANNTIKNNNMTNNQAGVMLEQSSGNTFRNNVLSQNEKNFGIFQFQHQLSNFINDIDRSNTVNGKPIYYWINRHNEEVPLGAGFIGLINCTNITIRNQDIRNNYQGILLAYTNNSWIERLNLMNNSVGIEIGKSNNNAISDNLVKNSERAIWLPIFAHNNTVVNNNVKDNSLCGICLENISNNNTVSGNNVENNSFGIQIGTAFDNYIVNNNITYNMNDGISLDGARNTIAGNQIANNNHNGISLKWASRNIVSGNNVTGNSFGICLGEAHENKIFHNNFIINTQQAYTYNSSENNWDNGHVSGGNYWSDYNGTDADRDGFGDTPYQINMNGTDNYPLMGMFHSFNASSGYHVNIISNSTIDDFQFFGSNSTIKMHISNMTVNQTFGFCRICIPKELMPPPYTVIIDNGLTDVLYFNDTICDNDTHRQIYFAYQHSVHEVIIIPEPLSLMVMPLLIMGYLLVLYKIKSVMGNKTKA